MITIIITITGIISTIKSSKEVADSIVFPEFVSAGIDGIMALFIVFPIEEKIGHKTKFKTIIPIIQTPTKIINGFKGIIKL
jgi:hypothetical protein